MKILTIIQRYHSDGQSGFGQTDFQWPWSRVDLIFGELDRRNSDMNIDHSCEGQEDGPDLKGKEKELVVVRTKGQEVAP